MAETENQLMQDDAQQNLITSRRQQLIKKRKLRTQQLSKYFEQQTGWSAQLMRPQWQDCDEGEIVLYEITASLDRMLATIIHHNHSDPNRRIIDNIEEYQQYEQCIGELILKIEDEIFKLVSGRYPDDEIDSNEQAQSNNFFSTAQRVMKNHNYKDDEIYDDNDDDEDNKNDGQNCSIQ